MPRTLRAVGTVAALAWFVALTTPAIAHPGNYPKCQRVRTACGNGTIEGNEQCDGGDLGGATCTSLGYSGGGTLACTAACVFDTSGCTCGPASTCGNGIKDGNEQCDGSDLGGATCASLGYTRDGTLACTAGCSYDRSGCKSQAFPATGQTTCWDESGMVIPCTGTGQDGDLRGAALAYVDNGDGTLTDVNTGLVWEKKSADGTIHDAGKLYRSPGEHVAGLNAANFAGHDDWRIPNPKELLSIVDYQTAFTTVAHPPAPAPPESAFNTGCTSGCTVLACSCPGSALWSSYRFARATGNTWFEAHGILLADFVDFTDPGWGVRAVRGP